MKKNILVKMLVLLVFLFCDNTIAQQGAIARATGNSYIVFDGFSLHEPQKLRQKCEFFSKALHVQAPAKILAKYEDACDVFKSEEELKRQKASEKYQYFVYVKINPDQSQEVKIEDWSIPKTNKPQIFKIENSSPQSQEKIFQEALFQENDNFLRASLETTLFLTMGFIYYWMTRDANRQDWEINWDWESWKKKLVTFEAVTLDNNTLMFNSPFHAIGGTFYYLAARSNNYNILESLLFATASSAIWEWFLEYREKVSINDMIYTPISGMAIGEVFSHLGEFFEKSAPTASNRIVSTLFSSLSKFNNWFDNKKPRSSRQLDALGLSQEIWHQFKIFSGMSHGTVEKSTGASGFNDTSNNEIIFKDNLEIGLETFLVNVPQYSKQGEVSKVLTDGNFTEMFLRSELGEKGLQYFRLFLKAALAGYYKQKIEKSESGNLNGYSFFIGASTATDFDYKDIVKKDFIGVVNIIGPTIYFQYFHENWRIQAVLDVSFDFAYVSSYALDEYTKNHKTDGIKTSLIKHGYYNAFGATARPKLVLQYGPAELGGQLAIHYFNSIEGHDRFQEEVTNDFNLSDKSLRYEGWLGYKFLNNRYQAVLSAVQDRRSGVIDEIKSSSKETSYFGKIVILF